MMTIVALGIVFADNEGCPCNPQPPVSKIKETENTEGNVQPMNTCMRSWIEYRNCGPKVYDEHEYVWMYLYLDKYGKILYVELLS
ncbi:hypothetical protein DRN58_02860 [Thermococci archaeon]|nr:MAG: hypothetical protein DRN58_02860 [Thermococci archaeon]